MFGAEPYQFQPTYPALGEEPAQHGEGEERSASTRTCMCREYGLVCLKKCIYMMSADQCYRILLTEDSVVRSEHFTVFKKLALGLLPTVSSETLERIGRELMGTKSKARLM